MQKIILLDSQEVYFLCCNIQMSFLKDILNCIDTILSCQEQEQKVSEGFSAILPGRDLYFKIFKASQAVLQVLIPAYTLGYCRVLILLCTYYKIAYQLQAVLDKTSCVATFQIFYCRALYMKHLVFMYLCTLVMERDTRKE